MKRILITGAGGSPSTNFVRSLRDAPEQFYIVGTDSDPYLLMRSEADTNYLIPKVSDPKYLQALNSIIKKEKISLIHAQNDNELASISANRDQLKAKVFLPEIEIVSICQNKFESYNKWEIANLKVPKTILINTKNELKQAFEILGGTIWLRAINGAGGKGSFSTSNFKQACCWVDLHDGWGSFTAAEMLDSRSVTWMSLWHKGSLVVAQGRKRLYWELSRLTMSGITGITGAGITISDPQVDKISIQAIKAIDKKPHGLYAVDLTYDSNKVPNPTEINIGRFFTTHYFFTKAGLNMPYLFVKLAFGETIPPVRKQINPLRKDLVWIRGVDFLPILTTKQAIAKQKKINFPL